MKKNIYWKEILNPLLYIVHLSFIHVCTVLPRSIAPRFIAKLAYRQNSRLSRFPPIKNTPLYCQARLPPSATGFQHWQKSANCTGHFRCEYNYSNLFIYYTPAPRTGRGGGIPFYLCPSVRPRYFSSHFSQ
jgi:hypothetical protein